MIKLKIKNKSQRPKFYVSDILDFVGCKMSSRKLLKAVWLRNGHGASLGVKVALEFQIPTAWRSKFTQKLENFDPSPEKPAQAYITRKQHKQGTRRQFFRCRAFRCKFLDSNTLEFQLWCSHILKNQELLRCKNHQVLSELNF